MAGAMRKMGVYLGLVEDEVDEYGYADEQYVEEYPDPRAARPREVVRSVDGFPARDAVDPTSPDRAWSTSTATSSTSPAPERSAYRITTLHPRTYNEARTIGEHFRSGVPVIMNLTDMDDSDAKRLVDFSAGLTFGLHGRIERVTNKVFLLSPHNVSVTAEEKARLVEGGFFNQS
jgi:cell division inhibitor SepF